jgi:hypothetical protein
MADLSKLPKIYLTPEEVEHCFGFRMGTLRKWRWLQRGPPYYKIEGGRIRYKASEIEAFMRRRRLQWTDTAKNVSGSDETGVEFDASNDPLPGSDEPIMGGVAAGREDQKLEGITLKEEDTNEG